MIIDHGNFIIDQNQQKYGGQQQDYLYARDYAIQTVLEDVRQAVKDKQDVQLLFFKILDSFAKVRHDIAIANKTDQARYFGRKRLDTVKELHYTTLGDEYQLYNHKIIQVIQDVMTKGTVSINGKIQVKKFKKEGEYIDRKCSFEVELLTKQDLRERQWNKPLHSDTFRLTVPNSYPLNICKINEDNYPLNEEDQKIVNEIRRRNKYVKTAHPNMHHHSKISTLLHSFNHTFLSSTSITKDNLYFIHAKVRFEVVKNKMYALSEYITWTHEDRVTHLTEGMKHSIVGIIHQDLFLIDDTLKEIANIYAQTLQAQQNIENLKDQAALIRYMFAHAMPYSRGSAAIGEWLEILLYQYHGFNCKHNSKMMGDLEALTAPLWSDFAKIYHQTIELTPNQL